MRKINYPILALIIANIIWGAASPIFKYSLQNIPPFSLAFLRFLIASLLLYPFVHKNIDYPDLKNKWLWAFALTGITINISFFFLGLKLTESVNAPVIASSAPIIILVCSAIFLREKIKKAAIVGTLLSFLGILLIIKGSLAGNFLLILSTLGYVASVVIGRKILTEKNSLGITFWSFLIGTVTFLPFMLLEYFQNPGWMANLDIRGWTGILYGGIFSSLIAYVIYDWALAKLPAYRTSIFTYLDPVVAIIIAIPLLGEKITPPFIIGSILVFLGILIAEKRLHYHPLHKLINKSNQPISNTTINNTQ